MSSLQRQKEKERIYLDRFLSLLRCRAIVVDSDPPDFLLRTPTSTTGVEVTELLKNDQPVSGSLAKRAERNRERMLQALATQYYDGGGEPANLQALWPSGSIFAPSSGLIGKLLELRNSLSEWEQARLEFGNDEVYYFRALPPAAGHYNRWICVSDSVGWVAKISQADLEARIRSKSAKLPMYKLKAERVGLLIVADQLTNAGRRRMEAPFAGIDACGFDEVHLLLYPDQTVRIDRGVAS